MKCLPSLHIKKINGKLNITFCPFQVQPIIFMFIPVYSGTILVHSTSFRCHSAFFGHIPVHSVPFLCLVLLWLILALHWCHFTSLRCDSGSFRYIPVPFLPIPFHSGVIPRRSGTFRFIPVYSVPFRSVPFLCLVTPGHKLKPTDSESNTKNKHVISRNVFNFIES